MNPYINTLGYHNFYYNQTDLKLYSFGDNGNGELGRSGGSSPLPIKLKNNKPIKSVYGGHSFSAVLDIANDLYTFGSNNCGQLGIGTFVDVSVPTKVVIPEGKEIQEVSLGWEHMLVLMTDGTVFSCGDNIAGQLGLGNTTNMNTLQEINLTKLTATRVKMIGAGGDASALFDMDNNLYNCGITENSKTLGVNSKVFEIVTNTPNLTPSKIMYGGWSIWILYADGSVYSGGKGEFTGTNTPNGDLAKLTKVVIPNGEKIKYANHGSTHSILISESDNVYGIGSNIRAQFGDDTLTPNPGVAKLKAVPNVIDVICTGYGTIFIDNNYESWYCGWNNFKQSGIDSQSEYFKTPTKITRFKEHTFYVQDVTTSEFININEYNEDTLAFSNGKVITTVGQLMDMSINNTPRLNLHSGDIQLITAEAKNPVSVIYTVGNKSFIKSKKYINIIDLAKKVDFFNIVGKCKVVFQEDDSLVWKAFDIDGNKIRLAASDTGDGFINEVSEKGNANLNIFIDKFNDLKNIKFGFLLEGHQDEIDKIQMQFDAYGSFDTIEPSININRNSLQINTTKNIKLMKTNILLNQ